MTASGDDPLRVQTGRTVIVTGAGAEDGIGLACARILGLQGATVIITSTTDRIFRRADELRGLGIDVHAVIADLLEPDGPDAVRSAALQRTGRVDALVNNAGLAAIGSADELTPLHTTTWTGWHASLARNLDTAFAMTRSQ